MENTWEKKWVEDIEYLKEELKKGIKIYLLIQRKKVSMKR